MKKTILSIDCGTQSLKSHIFDISGNLLGTIKKEYLPYFSTKPGWAEQDPELFWSSLCAGCRSLKSQYPDFFKNIAAVGVTTQRDTMICCDKNGKVLRPAITWLDQRKAAPVFKPNIFLKSLLKTFSMLETIYKIQSDGKCNWIIQNEKEIWEKTYKYLQVSGFLNLRLTNEFRDSKASQIGHIPFNYKKMKWAGRWEIPSLFFPIPKEKLPEVIEPGQIIGKITPEASKATGIKKGLPVIACGSDKGCETIGMGICSTDMASLSFGTTATVQTTSEKYFEPVRFMPPYPSPLPNCYNPEVEIFRGYWMITWYKKEFAHPEMKEACKTGEAPEKLLNSLLEKTPPGAMGLVLQPFWNPGLENPNSKGAIIGFGDIHTRAHVYRAVIEGLSYALLEGMHKIEKKSGVKIKQLGVSGGASQSDQICQISADIFNRPLMRGQTYETSGLGAAIITAFGAGFYSSVKEAVNYMVSYKDEFLPDSKNVSLYSEIYNRVYKKIQKALNPIYKEIRTITNYPEQNNF